MELKDKFFAIGIIATFIIGIVNIFITIKNRKNSLRESLYKKQLIFFSKLMEENFKLHSILIRAYHRKNFLESDHIIIDELIEKMFNTMHSNYYLMTESLTVKLTKFIDVMLKFQKSANADFEKNFVEYFEKSNNFLNSIRKEVGTDNLSKTNMKLYNTYNYK